VGLTSNLLRRLLTGVPEWAAPSVARAIRKIVDARHSRKPCSFRACLQTRIHRSRHSRGTFELDKDKAEVDAWKLGIDTHTLRAS